MSVLKSKRSVSKAEYVNTAKKIYVETISFLSRLSSRYSRLVSEPIMKLASDIIINAEKANSVLPVDAIRIAKREEHLVEAVMSAEALDMQLSLCYDIMMLNPSGCFVTSSNRDVDSSTAKRRLESMAERLGTMLDEEIRMVRAVLKSDKSKSA